MTAGPAPSDTARETGVFDLHAHLAFYDDPAAAARKLAAAGVGALFRMATRYADEAAVVALADPASQRDAARAAELLLQERQIPARLVVNRAVPKLFARMRATVDDVMDGVGLPLLGIVPDDASVTLAAAEGKPLVQYTYHGAALACLHIAKRLCGQRVPLMKITR